MTLPAAWPPGFQPLQRLSQGVQGSVWKALAGEEPCVLRVYRNTQAAQELDALAGLQDPLLARLLDFGTLPDGTFWLARQWIDGQPLPADLRAHLRSACTRPAACRRSSAAQSPAYHSRT